jgi:ankyrin repeat protein
MIEKGAKDFNGAMANAALNGHKDIVELMIEKGANNFNNAMSFAAENGHKEIVELLKKAKSKFNR